MRHLVMDSCCPTYIVSLCDLRSKDQYIFMESNTADVLHGAPVIFGNRNLVILSKWIGETESLLKVGKALLGDFKYVRCINVLKK